MADTLKLVKKIYRFESGGTVDALRPFNVRVCCRVRTSQKSLRELDKWLTP